ncbi:MAG: hypothetical protein WDO73_34475 [Ignavibacteriota bacterium]
MTEVLGSFHVIPLSTLNTSIRSSAEKRSVTRKLFLSDASRLKKPGPVRPEYVTGLVRSVYAGNLANTAVLNQPFGPGLETYGLPDASRPLKER